MAHISVVTPVYKAEACLETLYQRLVAVLAPITQNFEIIMVEDCGGDRSWQIIQELSRRDSRVKGIQFSRNFGQHYGITAGLDHCDGDWVVVMDCDLQDRPEEIPRLYAKAQEGYEVVIARSGRRSDHFPKSLFTWVFHKLFSYLTETEYDGQTGNFRILSRKVVVNFRLMREQLRFFGGLVKWMGFPSATIDVERGKRYEGHSTYTYRMLWTLAADTIIAYSDKPLRLAVRFGFVMSMLAFSYGITIVVLAIFYRFAVMGWASLIVSIYFIGGIIISLIGIIGIYLRKTLDEARKRPLYVIRNMTNV